MQDEIQRLIDDASVMMNTSGSYAFLPDIVDTLKAMRAKKQATKESRELLSRGLGRLVLDSIKFAESDLGGRILGFANDFAATQTSD